MKSLRIIMMAVVVMLSTYASVYALKGISATDEDVAHLRRDLRAGNLKVGITRIKDLVQEYGEPNKKLEGERKISLEYGDLKIEFDRRRYWREWSYDSFKRPAYTDKINLLRKKLESQKITGKNLLIEKFIKDYDEPTETILMADDGETSVYYYGDIRLTFENVYTLKSWDAKNLKDLTENQVSKSAQADGLTAKSPAPVPAAAK